MPDLDVAADLFRQMADHAPQVMVTVSVPALRVIYANRAAYRAAGVDGDGLVGHPVDEALAFIDRAMLEACAETGLAQRGAPARAGAAWWDVSYVALATAEMVAPLVLVTAVDVTAHERARAAGDTLEALLTYIPEGITISYGPDVHVAHISAQGVALTGRTEADLTGHSAIGHAGAWDVYRPGSDVRIPPADRPLARATRTGEVKMNETLLIHRPDGSILPVLCNSGPIRDAAGRVTGAVMAWHDISELQRAQSALRDSEERLRAVLLQIPAAIFIIEVPDGRVTFKSTMVDEVLGHPNPDLKAARTGLQGWAVHADGSAYDLSEYPSRRALFQGETVQAEPMTYSRGDGRLIDLEVYAGPVRNAAGDVVAAVVASLDVTQRKHAAERLRESEARLLVALEAGGLGTWEIDPATNTNHLGRSLAAMLGLPAEPVAFDRSVSANFLHPDDRERVAAEFASALGRGRRLHERVSRAEDGRRGALGHQPRPHHPRTRRQPGAGGGRPARRHRAAGARRPAARGGRGTRTSGARGRSPHQELAATGGQPARAAARATVGPRCGGGAGRRDRARDGSQRGAPGAASEPRSAARRARRHAARSVRACRHAEPGA